jgi:hypothetical protein
MSAFWGALVGFVGSLIVGVIAPAVSSRVRRRRDAEAARLASIRALVPQLAGITRNRAAVQGAEGYAAAVSLRVLLRADEDPIAAIVFWVFREVERGKKVDGVRAAMIESLARWSRDEWTPQQALKYFNEVAHAGLTFSGLIYDPTKDA